MNKDAILKDYVRRLGDEELSYLGLRSSQCLFGDRAEMAQYLSRHEVINRWLQTAKSAAELFDMFDQVGEHVERERSYRTREAVA